MAGDSRSIRRGLPRHRGGDPWPAVTEVPAEVLTVDGVSDVGDAGGADDSGDAGGLGDVAARASSPSVRQEAAAPAQGSGARADIASVRRGLPRVAGGEPWPPAPSTSAGSLSLPPVPSGGEHSESLPTLREDPAPRQGHGAVADAGVALAEAAGDVRSGDPGTGDGDDGAVLRRGLPRVSGGEAWPPQGTIPARSAPRTPPERAPIEPAALARDTAPEPSPPVAQSAESAPVRSFERAPLTVPRTVWPGRAAYHRPPAKPEPARLGPFTRLQWAGAVIVGGGALLVAAFLAVTFVRALLSMPFMQDFLASYPGEYHLPAGAPVGIPAWLGWQHFFNVFLMVLIIRTGLQVRREKRPSVFWTPRRNKKGKISLALWFHQALDILWLVNGAVFVVLLFVTGQWMRIVPTSWEVLPNALSAALQYVSLDWPTENGWVNYNSLQQLAYFSTVFVAAPLAAVTGYRMSGMWPKKAARLNAAYPVEWARKLHFPVMLYFVVFIFIHVALVLSTGALRNLNHMYAAQGSVDGVAYADNWTGFWMFFASLVVIAGAWVAARPLVLAPIAKLFGTVSSR